jgi:mono/diheme cytochrome c family protein
MFRLLRAIVLLALVIVIGAVVVIWFLQRNGFSARAQPGAIETAVALQMRHYIIPAEARGRKNPLQPSADSIRKGMEHFADHCAICHANDGSGNTEMGRGLYPKPPDMRSYRTQSLSDGEIEWIIANGVRLTGMPGFGSGGEHGPEDNWNLVQFIRHLPSLTDKEVDEMKRLNPKGPDEADEEKQIDDFLKGGTPEATPPPAAPHGHAHGGRKK